MYLFSPRKKQLDVQRLLRRAIDRSLPNKTPTRGDHRREGRSNRTLVVQIVPVVNGVLDVAAATAAITKNLSSDGVGLVVTSPPRAKQLVIGFLLDGQPLQLLGRVQNIVALGGGFHQIGVALKEIVKPDAFPQYVEVCRLIEALRAR